VKIRDRITQEIDMWEGIGAPAIMQRFILRNGEEFKAQPYSGRRGTPNECFCNAACDVGINDGTYAEGYGFRANLPLLIHHAWRVTDAGEVMDCTWDRPEECQYFGVRIKDKELWSELKRLGTYGILDTARGINVNWMLKVDPGMKEWVK
jgi:hypothetical protein